MRAPRGVAHILPLLVTVGPCDREADLLVLLALLIVVQIHPASDLDSIRPLRANPMEEGGTDIEELARLAQSFGLVAAVQEATVEQIRDLLRADRDIIAYLNRSVFDLPRLTDLTPALGSRRIHTVVPTRVTARQVTFHDPRLPAVVHKTIRRFEAAQRHLWLVCLVLSATAT